MNVMELMSAVCHNEVEAADGFSNIERSIFICQTFEVDNINLLHEFDYTLVCVSTDPTYVMAGYHLSRLQAQFFYALSQDTNSTAEDRLSFEVRTYFMHLISRRLENRYPAIVKGIEIPKETFIH